MWFRRLVPLGLGLLACSRPNPAYLGAHSGDPGTDDAASGASDSSDDAGRLRADAERTSVPAPDAGDDTSPPDDAGSPPPPLVTPDAGADVALLPEAAISSAVDLTTGLVGYWKMDSTVGQNLATDQSGHANTGTLQGLDVQKDWVTGKFGNALSLSGANNSYVGVKASASIDAIQSFTIGAWVQRSQTNGTHATSVLSRQTTASAETYNLTYSHDHLVIYLPYAGGKPYSATSPKTTPINQWVHIAATFDGARARLYENGVEVATVDYAFKLPATNNPLLIGNNVNADGAVQGFPGMVDEVVLYSVALPADAIAALAAGAQPLP